MREKTLNFVSIDVNKKNHKSKQPIDLDLVNLDHIVMSDKFRYTDDAFKYFIGYKEDNIIRPLCIMV